MQINNIQSNQSFGHLTFDERALNALRKRLKSASDVEKLQCLVAESKNNPLETRIVAVDHYLIGESNQFVGSTKFFSHGKTHEEYMREWEQNSFSRLIGSPIRFIKKVCKRADYIAEQVAKANEIDAKIATLQKCKSYS